MAPSALKGGEVIQASPVISLAVSSHRKAAGWPKSRRRTVSEDRVRSGAFPKEPRPGAAHCTRQAEILRVRL